MKFFKGVLIAAPIGLVLYALLYIAVRHFLHH
jgi:hypothetical protein